MQTSFIAPAIKCPLANVDLYWPSVLQRLYSLNIGSRLSQIGALATIAVETAHEFKPIKEFGSDQLHEKEYGNRHDLGNLSPGDGAKYCGRGLIQITGKVNYANYGKRLGVDLVSNPSLALSADIAAGIFAAYWKDHNIAAACEASDWISVRKKVNGGTNGYTDFFASVTRLLAIQ